MSKICLILAALLPLAAQRPGRPPRPAPAGLPETNPYLTPADVEAGRKLYLGRCGHCHGQEGEGGRGAVLNAGGLRRAAADRELFLVIRMGIPNTEMPAAFGLSDADTWRIAAYVKQLGRRGTPDPAAGDPAQGAAVYQRSGCAACHAIGGQGGFLGPDLTGIGARRAVRHLRQSLLDPNADLPLDYRTVTVVTAAGQTVSGIHLNEDEYSLHLRDRNGDLRSFLKAELKDWRLPRESLMPAYSSLPKEDLENLVAYLASLRGRP